MCLCMWLSPARGGKHTHTPPPQNDTTRHDTVPAHKQPRATVSCLVSRERFAGRIGRSRAYVCLQSPNRHVSGVSPVLWCVSHQALAGDKVDNRRYNKTRVRHPHRTLPYYSTPCLPYRALYWRQRRSGQLRKKEPLVVRVGTQVNFPVCFYFLSLHAAFSLFRPPKQPVPPFPSTVCDRVLPMRRSKTNHHTPCLHARMDPQHTPPQSSRLRPRARTLLVRGACVEQAHLFFAVSHIRGWWPGPLRGVVV